MLLIQINITLKGKVLFTWRLRLYIGLYTDIYDSVRKLNYEKSRFCPSLLIYYKLTHDVVTGWKGFVNG